MKMEKEKSFEIVWKHDAHRTECFSHIFEFDITSMRKNIYYFYSTRNIIGKITITLTVEQREIFRVDIEIYTRLLVTKRLD